MSETVDCEGKMFEHEMGICYYNSGTDYEFVVRSEEGWELMAARFVSDHQIHCVWKRPMRNPLTEEKLREK